METPSPILGVKFAGAFLAVNCAESPSIGCQFEGGGAVRISTDKLGKLQKIGR